MLSPLALAKVALLAGSLLNAHTASAAAIDRRDSAPVALSSSAIAAYKPYTWYAAAAYCSPSVTSTWNCGEDCTTESNFTVTAAGGDGNAVQYWYVGYDSGMKTIIVAHQGTDPTQFLADLTDLDFIQTSVNATTFPGISSGLKVHEGFLREQQLTASDITSAIKTTSSKYGSTKVTFVGHSLGGAIALLDAVYFKTNLPSFTVALRTYGMPRVGNQAFANWVDSNISDKTRVVNLNDPVAIIPFISWGFEHPSGQVHISNSLTSTATWYSCDGQENEHKGCSDGDTPSILSSNILAHLGPYDGLYLGECIFNN